MTNGGKCRAARRAVHRAEVRRSLEPRIRPTKAIFRDDYVPRPRNARDRLAERLQAAVEADDRKRVVGPGGGTSKKARQRRKTINGEVTT